MHPHQGSRREMPQRLIETRPSVLGLRETVIVAVTECAQVDQEVPVARGGERRTDRRIGDGFFLLQAGHERGQLLGFPERLDGRLEQVDLQHVEVACRPQDLAQPAHLVLDRLEALAADRGAEDLERRAQPPQRDAALVHPFRMQVEPRAVVVRGQLCEGIAHDQLECLSGRHVRGKAEPGRPRPMLARGLDQCVADVGFRPRVQAAVYDVAQPPRLGEQVLETAGHELQLDLVDLFALLPGDHGAFVQ